MPALASAVTAATVSVALLASGTPPAQLGSPSVANRTKRPSGLTGIEL